jgi:hypothetical protein
MHTLFVCDLRKFREVIDAETFYGMSSTHRFMNFTRFVQKNRLLGPSVDTFATILVVSCNVSSASVATTLICITHIKILIDTCNCNYFRKHLRK